jgi:hypothetical protein
VPTANGVRPGEQMPLSEAALRYATEFGWAVLPLHTPTPGGGCSCGPLCASPGKHPRTPNGVHDASKDPDVIRSWWNRWPDANIGIATGWMSGIVVVDVDGPKGEESLHKMCGNPPTAVALTGRGRHLYFEHPGEPVPGRVGLASKVDVRSDGGYVVAPPSLHASGHRYRWDTETGLAPGQCPLAPLPVALRQQGRSRARVQARVNLETIRQGVAEGARNDTLTRFAGSLLGRGFPPEDALALCLAVNATYCAPPLHEGEVAKIVASIASREAQKRSLEGANGGAPSEPEEHQRHQAQLLVAIAAEAELFHTPDGKAYATFPQAGHRETWSVRSSGFRQWLTWRFYESEGKPPGKQAMESAIALLEARARFDGPRHQVWVRVARGEDDAVYLDLGNENWEAVKVTPEGWQVVADPPVRFLRPRGLGALPRPERGGSIDLMRPLVNVAEGDDWALFCSVLLAHLWPSGPYPVLVLQGEQGTGKSTLVELIRALVDPSTVPLRTAPRDLRDLAIAASNSWILAFDNLSHVPDWLSDGFCRLATGGGFGTRQLYTDDEEVLFQAQRPIILNGIEELATRDDLRDRSVILSLRPIRESTRREVAKLWSEARARLPRILGALLGAVSTAMRRLSEVRLHELPRMADFARLATAAEPGLGLEDGAFMGAYMGNRAEAIELSVQSSPLPQAVCKLAAEGPWEGRATELLEALNSRVPDAVR